MAELLQDGNIIDIDAHPQFHRLFNLFYGDTVGGIENIPGGKPGFQSQANFLYRNGIQSRSQSPEQLQNIDIGQRLTGIVRFLPGCPGKARVIRSY